MTLSQIKIHNFRNIDYAELSLSNHFNYIVGDNGSGKTSLLEAIYMLGHGRAFRHIQSNRIIQHEKPELVLFSQIESSQQIRTIGLSKTRNNDNTIKIDGDEGLLTGGPKYRRAFIDWGCFHHYPEFVSLWNNLKRLFKQRNALLKQSSNYNQLLPWDKELIPIAEKISQIRADYSQNIFPQIIETCRNFLPEYQLHCQYYQGWEYGMNYSDILYKQFERDKFINYTSLGPHKADIKLRIDNIPVEDLLSRGQLKLLMCALRLSQGEYFSEKTGLSCIYLIDDFTSELDQNKRNLLAKRLKSAKSQVFITAVNQEQITHMIDENDKIFHIKSGIIS